MTPTLYPGDRVLIDYHRATAVGDVVVASFPDGTRVVKRAAEDRGGAWFLRSDNAEAPGATDSLARGPIREDDVHGVVRVRLWPRPGRVRRAV